MLCHWCPILFFDAYVVYLLQLITEHFWLIYLYILFQVQRELWPVEVCLIFKEILFAWHQSKIAFAATRKTVSNSLTLRINASDLIFFFFFFSSFVLFYLLIVVVLLLLLFLLSSPASLLLLVLSSSSSSSRLLVLLVPIIYLFLLLLLTPCFYCVIFFMNIVVVSYDSLCCIVYSSTVKKSATATPLWRVVQSYPAHAESKGYSIVPTQWAAKVIMWRELGLKGLISLPWRCADCPLFLESLKQTTVWKRSVPGTCYNVSTSLSRVQTRLWLLLLLLLLLFCFCFVSFFVFFLLPAKVGRGCLTSSSCLESQVVIWFPFPISCLILLPNPAALSASSFFCFVCLFFC